MKTQSNNAPRAIQFFLVLLIIGLGIYLFIPPGNESADGGAGQAAGIDLEGIAPVKPDRMEFPPVSAYQEIVDRPLFMADRRPYEIPPAAATPTNQREPGLQQFSLSGVVITADQNIAVLQYADGKTLQRVALGEVIDGWTLTEVHEQHVVLQKGEDTRILELEIKGRKPKQSPANKPNNENVGG